MLLSHVVGHSCNAHASSTSHELLKGCKCWVCIGRRNGKIQVLKCAVVGFVEWIIVCDFGLKFGELEWTNLFNLHTSLSCTVLKN